MNGRAPLRRAAPRWVPSSPARRPVPWLLATLVVASCLPEGGLKQGDPLPHFSAPSLTENSPVALTEYEGQVLLVNLWATWCVPCRTETPYLQSLYETYREDGLRIVGISVDPSGALDEVEGFVDEMGVTYDILLDPDGRSEAVFRARGLPNSILVDRAGTVSFSWLGPIEEGDPTFLAGLEQALSDPRRSSPAKRLEVDPSGGEETGDHLAPGELDL